MFESQQFQAQSIWLSGPLEQQDQIHRSQEASHELGRPSTLAAFFREWIQHGLVKKLSALRGTASIEKAGPSCTNASLQACC